MLEFLGLILGILGLFGFRELLKFFDSTVWRWWILRVWKPERVKSEVTTLAKRHAISFDGPKDAASFGKPVLVRHFVDFLSAATHPAEKMLLERCASRWIQISFNRLPTVIAVPKLGNILFAEAVARRLDLPLVIVRQELFIRGGATMEGRLNAGDSVLVLDDVASDGDFLVRCVEHLQAFQSTVMGVLVLINRVEGTARETLAAKGIAFEPVVEISDVDLEGPAKGISAVGR